MVSSLMECYGMEWNGMEWNGSEWNGMEWTRREEIGVGQYGMQSTRLKMSGIQ